MPCERCWNAKPRRRCVMVAGSNKCSSCVRMGKKCSGPNVAGALIANMSARDKVDKEIVDAERQLAEALSRISRLRQQRQKLAEAGSSLRDRGLESLEEDESDPPEPMSEEQELAGQAQALDAFGVVDWELNGAFPYGSGSFDNFLPGGSLVGQGFSDGTLSVSQGSGGS
ncbi:hypothetical protein N656DRAFT_848923 [Canariomyces notabilis]|uniref:Zn(2)-C6 fungal-type domain-containing protein n=1 Tax=Canariomyces notabilis TaxID=2074819 RepID=A0AAN6T7W9_9PEZI|nr:hypothetical protein N656DRAFT_848923 [Canariomyces arenarius]